MADECGWTVGRMTMKGQNPSIQRKTYPNALYPPHISNGQPWD
jgi:hypothetical protein